MKQNTNETLGSVKGNVPSKQIKNWSPTKSSNLEGVKTYVNYSIQHCERNLNNTLSPISCDIFELLVHPTTHGKNFQVGFEKGDSNCLTLNDRACNKLADNLIDANSIECPMPLPRTSASLTLRLTKNRVLVLMRYFPETPDSSDQGNKTRELSSPRLDSN